jgi:RNA polymerase sigma factor (sigma-70 family)
MEVIKQLSEVELIHRVKSGIDMNGSVKFIYLQYFESLSWFIINNSGSRQDAEDIFQETVVSFIELVQKDKFRGESSIKTFLFSLNRNIWLNELKRRGRADARELKYEKAQDRTEMDVSVAIVDREARSQLMKIMSELGEGCKKILLMFYYEDLPMKEIVAHTDYENEQVVRNKKYKCLKQLGQMIETNPSLAKTLKNLLNG